ncbi:histidine kinase N-terminal 7TM domain-containing protein [Haloarchaeobius sp. TZWWS8]|uniref:histidine kinase N-terminal 7TM domain-containing protein n=1 Tax=Haloarchaeobius sp. TZWWS8 TaxID=3446121 RepID=UPI003EC06AB0
MSIVLFAMSVLLFTAVVAVLVATLTYQQRPKPGATWLTLLLLAVAWWAALYAMELPIGTLSARMPLMKVQWLASSTISVFWLLFTLEYTGRDQYVTHRSVAALLAVPALIVGLVFTFEHHSLIYAATPELVPRGGAFVIDHTFGPMFYVYAGYALALSFAGSLVLVPLLFERYATHREQSVALLIAMITPWIGETLYILDVDALGGVDPTPMALLVSGFASYVALSKLDLFTAMPVPEHIARDFVIEGMDDPVIVIDTRGRIVDLNEAATNVVGLPVPVAIGSRAVDTVPGFPETADSGTLTVEIGAGVRHFDVHTSTITDAHDRELGTVLTMRDVTEREQDEQRLTVLNRVLRHNLRNDMNVVAGCAEELRSRVDDDDVELATIIAETATEVAALGDTARQIEDLLDEPKSGRIVDLRVVLGETLARAESEFPGATFTLEWAISEPVECRETIEPVLWHLLRNAAGCDSVTSPNVRVFVTTTPAGYISITVADDGPPIPATERNVLKNGTETPLDHASGLGLWLVVWGVRAMGGAVDFEAHEDTGNAVTIHFPVTSTPPGTRHRADVRR